MKSKYQIPRSPRNFVAKKPRKFFVRAGPWIERGFLLVLGALLSAFGGVVSQGPDAIRKLPEVPDALAETVTKTWESKQIDWQLTGVWEYLPPAGKTPIRLEFESKGGRMAGQLFSPAVRKWTIYDMAFIEGKHEGRFLLLTVFEFIGGERVKLAELKVRFQEEPAEISDHFPALVLDELEAETVWQLRPALPNDFTLRRVGG